ncbi:hypothetical protein K450DRAFT_235344 [Umbelopsis ramanniana AG]|uniref:Uncharacterized protein n=1 Tax=Umbelopsis ramanniana AG TaxID=1314678 RepID=A0AAD5ED09_UMBRA|nr:uncharacterized protein K450DRAFT_235344 [Umbelopsis ramanniana AG]KAI8580939.1 hypothetical protein K450DRAFT_235344 [Umbelopsis ramanniana AG]
MKWSKERIFRDWCHVPLVIVSLFCVMWGVDVVLKHIPPLRSFPASVASMLLLFVLLLIFDRLDARRTSKLVSVLEPGTGFVLRWINIFLMPSFLNLPTIERPTAKEVGEIAVVFIVGYLCFVTASTLLVRAFRIVSPFKYLSRKRDEDIARTDDAEQIAQHVNREFQLETEGTEQQIEEIELNRIPTKTDSSILTSISDLQLGRPPSLYNLPNDDHLNATDNPSETVDNKSEALSSTQGVLEQQPAKSKWKRATSYIWQRLKIAHLVYITMLVISFIIYLPVSTDSPIYLLVLLPLYLSMTILSYYLALQVPERIRFFLHPIISASAIVMLGMEVTEAIKGGNLLTGLSKYSTGARYLTLLEGTSQGRIPGAGDVLFSLLDCSIISLSTVMFRYRKELKKHAFEMLLTILCMSIASLFTLPLFAHALGVSPAKSLSLAPRSVTTPLAMVVATMLEADANSTVCFVILTGILGTILGPYLLKLLRVKEDDYVTIGVSMGSASHAISTASLLRTNPRAAAIASLSFVIFGTIFVILVSIPVIPQTMRQLVGF